MAKIKHPIITENENLQKEISYPNEFDTNRPLYIKVQAPYELVVEGGQTFVICEGLSKTIAKEKEGKTEYFESSNISYYNPFEKFDIETFINVVMAIDLTDPKAILNFYNNYGPLGYAGMGMKIKEAEINNTTNRMYGVNEDTSIEKLSLFKEEIYKLQNLLGIYQAIQEENPEYLYKNELIKKYNLLLRDKITEETPKEKLFLLAKKSLLRAVNEKSDLMNPVAYLSPQGEFVRAMSSSCVLGVFYTRLFDLMTEKTKIRKCLFCDNYFKPRKKDTDFCPPDQAGEKSKCVNNYDSLKRRIVAWHFKDGLTIEEIQKKVTKPKTRSIAEIQYILDNYTGKMKK
jgi:hypothetical protein